MQQARALPSKSIQRLSVQERMLGRNVTLDIAPQGVELDPAAINDLAGDTFFSLLKRQPEYLEPGQVPAGRRVNAKLLELARSSGTFEAAKAQTAGNLLAAAKAATLLHASFTTDEFYQEALEAQAAEDKAAAEAEQARNEAEALEQAAAAAEAEGDAEQAAELGQAAAEAGARANEAKAKAQAAAEAVEAELEALEGDQMVKAAVQAALNQATEEAEQVNGMIKAWGSEVGNEIKEDLAAAREFEKRMSGKLKRIAEMIGRCRGIAFNAKANKAGDGFIPTDVKLTQALPALMPEELARLSGYNHPALRATAIAEYLSNGLMGWDYTGPAEEAGPFIAAVDESGSMSGSREIAAKGMILGIAQAARAEGRDWSIGAFSSAGDDIRPVTSADSWQGLLDWAERFIDGGTDFDKALGWAMDRLEADYEAARNADVLILTDGYGHVNPATAERWQALSAETGARLIYLPLVAAEAAEGDPIGKLADRVIRLADIEAGAESATAEVAAWLR